jgi:hypothetical protein
MSDPSPVSIPIGALRIRTDYLARDTLADKRHVQALVESDADSWPPIKVTPLKDGSGNYAVVGGIHRVAAASKLGLKTLFCIVLDNAGYREAVMDNLTHGLTLSTSERKRYAVWLHGEHPDYSLRELGRLSGLNHETVKSALAGEGGGNRRPAEGIAPPPEAMVRAFRLVVRAFQDGNGVHFWGAEHRADYLQRLLDGLDDDERLHAAKALDAWGVACVEAAKPFLP